MITTQPWCDPIIAEIHTTREHLAELYHNDLEAYSQAAQKHCQELGFKIVKSPRLQRNTGELHYETKH